MLSTIKSYFDEKLKLVKNESEEQRSKCTDLASAALMIEVMKSDHELDAREEEEFLRVLEGSLEIPAAELDTMQQLAKQEAKQATSLYEFTRLFNDEYDYGQKVRLIENMWRIAFSDEKLDKYEDHLIRKVAELIYVSHSDFIKAKLKVRDG